MFVYLIGAYPHAQGEKAAACKVGVASNIEARLRALQTGHHMPLSVICHWLAKDKEEALKVERMAHERFLSSRLSGEWFAPAIRDMATFIDGILGAGVRRKAVINRSRHKNVNKAFESEIAALQQNASELRRQVSDLWAAKRSAEARVAELERALASQNSAYEALSQTAAWHAELAAKTRRGEGFVTWPSRTAIHA